MPFRKIITEVFVYLIALLWLYTSVYKLLEIDRSINQLGNSPFVAPYAVWFGYGLPLLEFTLFVLLLLPKTRRIGLYGSAILLTLFTAYIMVILNFYRKDVPCSCGGIISQLGWKKHIYFNLGFVLMSMYALLEPHYTSKGRNRDQVSWSQT